jgi:hypothetical protein
MIAPSSWRRGSILTQFPSISATSDAATEHIDPPRIRLMVLLMTAAAFTLSIDLELAWGNWDNLQQKHIENIGKSERHITTRLLEILDRYEIPATWAFVAALLDARSAKNRPGGEHLWYAPDVIERIANARVKHEFGSHSGHHKYFDALTVSEADDELAFARAVHHEHGLPFVSFVFPRNKVSKASLLEKHGIRVYRGEDNAWHQRIRSRSQTAGRMANLMDKMLPIPPETVLPERTDGLVNLPGSMLFFGRQGIRRFVPSGTMRLKLAKGVSAAIQTSRIFHLWFHPSNFWFDPETQFAIFDEFLGDVARLRDRGQISIKPMAAFA